MATVLHSWDPTAAGDKFTPPIGFMPLAPAEHAMVLVRTTLSYVPPDRRPSIWLERCGWGFEHVIAAPRDLVLTFPHHKNAVALLFQILDMLLVARSSRAWHAICSRSI